MAFFSQKSPRHQLSRVQGNRTSKSGSIEFVIDLQLVVSADSDILDSKQRQCFYLESVSMRKRRLIC